MILSVIKQYLAENNFTIIPASVGFLYHFLDFPEFLTTSLIPIARSVKNDLVSSTSDYNYIIVSVGNPCSPSLETNSFICNTCSSSLGINSFSWQPLLTRFGNKLQLNCYHIRLKKINEDYY